LLIPDSGDWPVGSEEAEQMKALDILLGDSKMLLGASPVWLSRDFSLGTAEGNRIEIGKGYFSLRLVTGLGKPRIGAKLCYDLKVEANSARNTPVLVRQTLHLRELGELAPSSNVVRLFR